MSRMQSAARALLVLCGLVGLGIGAAPAAASCAHHDQTPLTREYMLAFAYDVDQVAGQRYDVSLRPEDSALFERIFNRIYQCKPELLDPRKNDYSGYHKNIQRIVNGFHTQACYFTLDHEVAGFMVKIMRALHKCFPE